VTHLVSRLSLVSLLASAPIEAAAQGEIRGRVLADTGRFAVAGAELRLLGFAITATTDSAGRFVLSGIPKGEHLLVVRAVGFGADTSDVTFSANEMLFKDVELRRATQVLEPVNVRASEMRVEAPWRQDFLRRKDTGIGRQLDRSALERYSNRTFVDVLAEMPGVDLRRGSGGKAWAASGRAQSGGGCVFCRVSREEVLDPADIAAGAWPACYMDVYFDGVPIYVGANARPSGTPATPPGAASGARTSRSTAPPLFDLGSLRPEQIEAVEVYSSASQVPAQYNKTSAGCGVILVWLRR
jgi:hypothetical protein